VAAALVTPFGEDRDATLMPHHPNVPTNAAQQTAKQPPRRTPANHVLSSQVLQLRAPGGECHRLKS